MCKLDRETDEGAANHEEAREWCPWEGESVSKKGGGRNAEKNWGPEAPPSSGAMASAQRQHIVMDSGVPVTQEWGAEMRMYIQEGEVE